MNTASRQTRMLLLPWEGGMPVAIQPETALPFALERLTRLQQEIEALRKALFLAERAAAQKETLLRNAHRREMELRAQLVRRNF